MPKELVISATPHETRVALLEDGLLCEIYIEREKEFALVGSIYKGRVTRVLPGMQSSFVDIGLDSDAFLYVGDFLENLEDYDHVVTTVEGKVEKMEEQGGTVFPTSASVEDNAALSGLPLAPEAEPSATESDAPGASESGAAESAEHTAQETPAQPPRSFAPSQPPFQREGQGSRGPGGFGQRSGQGGRGGRWRGGRGRQGRDLPPSKYASPRPFTPRPYEPPASAPPADYVPVILPGESLAKYKDRAPAIAPRPAEPATDLSAASTAAETAKTGFPQSVYAPRGERPVSEPQETSALPVGGEEKPASRSIDEEAAEFGGESARVSEEAAQSEEPLRAASELDEERTDPQAATAGGADLSEEDVTVLSEELAEARQEEVVASAEAVAQAGESEEEEVASAEAEDNTEPEDNEADDNGADAEGNGASGEQAEAQTADQTEDQKEEQRAAAIEAAGETAAEPLTAEAGGPGHAEPHPAEQQPTSARISDTQRARFQRPMRRGGRFRSDRQGRQGRPQDYRRPPQAQRRPQLISEMLKAGQEIIVQIAKEPLGKKGARITSHVALPGRFLVYMPTVNHIGVSRRIASAEERSRLRRLLTESKGTFPGGFIVRTAAEGAPDDEIRADVEFLGRTWDKIRAQGESHKAPSLLHRDLNLVERILRDYVNNDYSAIWIDNEEEFSKVVDFVGRFQPKLVSRVKLYTKASPIFEEFGIQQELDRALRPKVWLKSGGYIVINHTEALVAIDVNTGKYVGRGGTRLEDTIVKTNLEAVKEIIRQIRLRDLGGIIVLDFIDMEERRNRDKVMVALDSALRADRAPSKALNFNEFGLVCVTRKRTKQALERVLCQPCPYCTGSGMVKSVPTICYEIQAEARKMAADLDASSITLRVHPEIAKALKTREAALIDELEQVTRKSIIIQADPTLHWEQYDIY